MDFSLIGPDKLKIMLTREELEELDIQYDEVDYSDSETRRTLLKLLEQGSAEAGFHPRRSRLFIEIFPGGGGGCVIYYTRVSGGEVLSQGRFVPGPVPAVFAFKRAETLIECCKKFMPLCGHRIYKSALYRLKGRLRLVIWPLDYNDRLSVSFLSEYGRLVGEGNLLFSHIEEHGETVLESDAVETVSEL
ncbi:MAG: adaptor protein MecA [Oscillospiraceae bacterium]|jgi:negative regulator of genetic competence, sporulation and motility|nr:adaptor protein MecA [Oscillospiraceae bacterium]